VENGNFGALSRTYRLQRQKHLLARHAWEILNEMQISHSLFKDNMADTQFSNQARNGNPATKIIKLCYLNQWEGTLSPNEPSSEEYHCLLRHTRSRDKSD
jgi:hypothetical protein